MDSRGGWIEVDSGGSRWIQVDPGGFSLLLPRPVDPGGSRWIQERRLLPRPASILASHSLVSGRGPLEWDLPRPRARQNATRRAAVQF